MTVIWQPALERGGRALAGGGGARYAASILRRSPRSSTASSDTPGRTCAGWSSTIWRACSSRKEHGGQGASLSATVAVVEAIGTGCASTAAILCTYQLGAFPVLLAGRDDQKRRYLGEMAKGVATSFALSERSTGSDAAAIETTATREGDGWRLRGEKYWIGNGGASRYYVVFAKTDPARGRARNLGLHGRQGAARRRRRRACRQDGHPRHADLEPEARHRRAGQRAGRRAQSGAAPRLATLDVGRVMVAAQSLGLALAAYREASRRAVERRAFGQPIIENQGIGFKLADMAVEISAARMMLYEAAKAYDEGRDVANSRRDGEALCLRGGAQGGRRRRAGLGRAGILQADGRGAPLPRPARPRNLRRHVGDPAARACARRAQGGRGGRRARKSGTSVGVSPATAMLRESYCLAVSPLRA